MLVFTLQGHPSQLSHSDPCLPDVRMHLPLPYPRSCRAFVATGRLHASKTSPKLYSQAAAPPTGPRIPWHGARAGQVRFQVLVTFSIACWRLLARAALLLAGLCDCSRFVVTHFYLEAPLASHTAAQSHNWHIIEGRKDSQKTVFNAMLLHSMILKLSPEPTSRALS